MLTLQTRNVEPDIAVVEIEGRITMGRDSKQLEWSTENLLKENKKKVVFDLSRVTHIDSTGIGIIVMCAGQLKQAGGTLRVCATGHVDEVLRLTSVDKVIDLHPSLSDATAGF
jgi:anti-anti-sigma factor